MNKTVRGAVRIERPEDAPKVALDVVNAGDLDGVVKLFEPEAVLCAGSGQVAKGSAEIREVFAGLLPTWKWSDIKLISHNRVDDIALITVEHTLRHNTADGSPNTLRLRAAVVIRRQADGSWRIAIDNATPFGVEQ